jgi:hypothetical protein
VCSTDQVCAPTGGVGACTLKCPTGTTNCGGSCVDTKVDPNHCGSCSGVCTTDQVCVATAGVGACTLKCPTGQTNCSGTCTNLDNDPAHCGLCTTSCTSPAGATAVCIAKTCDYACNAGKADCDGDATTGCEIDLMTDSANCGKCGNACTGSKTCVSGTCT